MAVSVGARSRASACEASRPATVARCGPSTGRRPSPHAVHATTATSVPTRAALHTRARASLLAEAAAVGGAARPGMLTATTPSSSS